MAVEHAVLSSGSSNEAIHGLVDRVVRNGSHVHDTVHDTVVDVGCGTGSIARTLLGSFRQYVGCDGVRYESFPHESWASFVQADLDKPPYPIADGTADLVLAIEVIEHLENPRAFVRELVRMLKPGGRLVVTTPNQLSVLSKVSLVMRNQFHAFQEAPGLYPTHITALVEIDLRHIAQENRLTDVEVRYTDRGRIPFTGRHWPHGFRGRAFSDNVLLTGVKS
ncbi:class I SAM-dependent methyltransferase [Pendulispora brunnea]|uniref:Class I SAM-dependent methyltransferase n=1 Tax=Pendulispora brunnea TaxID=2905690 RepID=A0ABZ2KH35_9BACT